MSRNNVVGSEPYHKCTDAYTKGHSLEKVISYYNNWAQEGTYETVLCADHYSGPEIVAQFVEHYFGDRKDDTSIIDVAAGTGRVGEELKIRGFTKVDAIEPSKEMLSIAATKNIYGRIIHDCMDGHRTDIKDDTYDALTIAGGMGEGHIPTRAMTELIRIVKPGGYVCIVMREEFLDIVADYTDRLEPFMHQLAEQGAWTREERRVIPKYSFGTNGVVFVFRVKESGAPTVTSTQFTK